MDALFFITTIIYMIKNSKALFKIVKFLNVLDVVLSA